jgi:hypothetical protein
MRRTRPPRIFGAALLLSVAAACTTPQPPPDATAPAEVAAPQSASPEPRAREPAAPEPAAREPDEPEVGAVAPPPPTLEELLEQNGVRALLGPGPVAGPAPLKGLDHTQVTALLGEPQFMRRDRPAQIWQYRSARCALDLFLYEDPGGATHRVQHLEVRADRPARVSERACFRGLLEHRFRNPR